ncbi:hypothetical protein [Rhodopseudomonas pseudopalustris]|uniref:Uncharacterized protein n=2 Tax=Rhodopseudomonas TaxID=1073 RepID=Q136S0_RHOPS|nr:hypothetical protein [Rhodopseudomonas pseudopalustris]ABE39919.1 conserved hypothetical protein [Rhodopseudomonas palustris BisB5]SEO84060.1 hypothetical protein SAMN05444123_105143 [Rhodopseudomonas pseudopalustris]
MLAATFQTAAFLFLLLVAVLTVAVFIAFTAPPLTGSSRPGFTTVLLYLAAELAALIVAIWLVVQVSELELLPVLIALGIAAVVFAPQLVARIPLPAAVTGFLGKK